MSDPIGKSILQQMRASAHDEAQRAMMSGAVATMMATINVAATLVEGLIQRGVISVDDGRAILGVTVERIRRDGDEHDGKFKHAAYAIAGDLEKCAFALGK